MNRLGLEYIHQTFDVRSIVERFSGYLKQRTERFHNNINTWKIQSMGDYATIAKIRKIPIANKNSRSGITWLTGSILLSKGIKPTCFHVLLRCL